MPTSEKPISPNDPAARIAISVHPFAHIAIARVVAGDREWDVPVPHVEHPLEIGRADHDVVIGIGDQPVAVEADTHLAGLLARRPGHQLHHPASAGMAERIGIERAFLPADAVRERPHPA